MIRDFNWDDLKFYLAVARGGSLPKAAAALGVSEGTVSRRIQALERVLGARLFDRISSGHASTELGAQVLPIAQRIEHELHRFCAVIEGDDQRLEGPLVVTMPSTLLNTWLLPHFRAFASRHPAIALEIRETAALENLHQRQADVAIRAAREAPEGLVGRRALRLAFATYVRRGALTDATGWIGWTERRGEEEWKAGPFGSRPVVHRVTTSWSAFEAAKAGLGLARLECYLAEPAPELQRVDEAHFERYVWLLTHQSLRKTGRVRVFQDFMYARIREDQERIEADAAAFREPRPPSG